MEASETDIKFKEGKIKLEQYLESFEVFDEEV
jgi:hypothetical protein